MTRVPNPATDTPRAPEESHREIGNAVADSKAAPMHYSITGPDGVVFDQAIANLSPDPFYDPCPAWCDQAGPHEIESSDADRYHAGERIGIPVRSLRCEYETTDNGPGLVILRTVQTYLRRPVLHRDATIWLGDGESSTGFELALDEAETIARTLLGLVETARTGGAR